MMHDQLKMRIRLPKAIHMALDWYGAEAACGRKLVANPSISSAELTQVLKELEHMVAYWDQQAARAQRPKQAAIYLRKRERAAHMAAQIQKELSEASENEIATTATSASGPDLTGG